MTKFSKIDMDITQYKPKMKAVYAATLDDLKIIPIWQSKNSTAQVKADGEFSFIHMDRNSIYAVNRFGRKTEDLPALRELHVLFMKNKDMLQSCELLAEMYAVEESGKPLSLPNFIHYLKGEDKSLHDKIHLGIFDVLSIDGSPVACFFRSKERFEMLEAFDGNLCHVLDWVEVANTEALQKYYELQVTKGGWEGLVIRTNGDTWKAKPNRDIDAVVIGINKNNKGYEKGLAKSLKLALLNDDGTFVELGDATVPSEAEARAMFELTRVKVNEDTNTAFVKPLVIVQVNYISAFPNTVNRIYKLLVGGYADAGQQTLVRLKSPRVVAYRKDKKVCVEDVGLNQVGE